MSESGGRTGWATESSGGDAAVPRTPWHRSQPPGPAARRQLWPAGAPSPTAGRGPGGCWRGGGGVGRGLQASRPSPASSLKGAGRGGRPRKGGAPGRAAGGPQGAPRTKGDGDCSSVVKTTCAGGGPRSGRGLGALHLNPFAAAAAAASPPRRRPTGARPPGSGRGADSRPPRSRSGTGLSTPRSPQPSAPLRPAPPPCPAPFPTWIPGTLANSLLREAGRGGGLIRPIALADVFIPHLPCGSPFPGGALRTLQARKRGASSLRAREQVWRGLRHTPPWGWIPEEPPRLPNPECPKPVFRPHPSSTAPKTQAAPGPRSGAGMPCTGPRAPTLTRSGS